MMSDKVYISPEIEAVTVETEAQLLQSSYSIIISDDVSFENEI